MRGITAYAVKKDGTKDIIKQPSDWSDIPAESTAETLFDIVCTKGKKDNKK